jgi:hypothetical protein
MKTASIYKRPNKGYLVFGQSKTVSGIRIASEPFIKIAENEGDVNAIASAIKASLSNDDSQRVANPQNWNEFNKDFLKKIGLKSPKELDNPDTKLVAISDDGNYITFKPMRFQVKPDRGYLNLNEDETVNIVNTASNDDIVTAYKLALSKCK